MTREILRKIITYAIEWHPKECIFSPNAIDTILNKATPHLNEDPEKLLDRIEGWIFDEEIYCPSEGIDRREEFGFDQKTTT